MNALRAAAAWMLSTPLVLLGILPSGAAERPAGVIYPSGPTVPENLLRIELRFSAPLAAAPSMEHVRLNDGRGREIEQAFLDLPLLSPDGRRVTLLLHPGRVKSGVGANLALGRALHTGSTVSLVVDDPALAQPIRKTWQVSAAAVDFPHPEKWSFTPPRQASRDPLVVRLHGPVSAAAEFLIAVRAPDGQRLAGNSELEDGETVWRFVPAQPWRSGVHAVVTHPDLEDPAGNRPCGSFEAIAASLMRCDEGAALEFEPLREGEHRK